MKNTTEYTYTFATGENINLTAEQISDKWIHILVGMDREEYNNEHAETRRHSSLDFMDPGECIFQARRDGFDDFEARLIWDEMKKKLTCREALIAESYFIEGFKPSEIAHHIGLTPRRVRQILYSIRKKLKRN